MKATTGYLRKCVNIFVSIFLVKIEMPMLSFHRVFANHRLMDSCHENVCYGRYYLRTMANAAGEQCIGLKWDLLTLRVFF